MQPTDGTVEHVHRHADDLGTSDPLARIATATRQDNDAALAQAAVDYLATQAEQDGDWHAWALALQRLPWAFDGDTNAALASFQATAKASNVESARFFDSRQIIGKETVRLARQGAGARDLTDAMRALNAQLNLPLPKAMLDAVVLDAVERVVLGNG